MTLHLNIFSNLSIISYWIGGLLLIIFVVYLIETGIQRSQIEKELPLWNNSFSLTGAQYKLKSIKENSLFSSLILIGVLIFLSDFWKYEYNGGIKEGISFIYTEETLSHTYWIIFLILLITLTTLIILGTTYNFIGLDGSRVEDTLLILIGVLGIIELLLYKNLINLYLSFEIISFSSYVLIGRGFIKTGGKDTY